MSKENLFFPLSRGEIDEIGIGKTVLKHYHLRTLDTLFVLVGFTKHRKEKFDQVIKKGISVTSIAIKHSDLEKIENGDSVSAEYDEIRVIILSDLSLKKLQKEELQQKARLGR
ncbi:MAG: hypothetical protein OEZ48_00080 [Candidatus Bathyarchaeota archaeon]|nr:hypothetical protein [Candidatus Bathyarchaeota archaeon]MDH5686253.1 hypothetical protein [Candidatus Bathyarchaeota archaeon]